MIIQGKLKQGRYMGDSRMEGRNAAESMSHSVHDLVFEILLRLPSKSLMRFKSVCKSWRALIISKYFCLLWRQHHQGPGLLLISLLKKPEHSYVPLSGPTAGKPQFKIPRVHYQLIMQSCNGFLLYRKYDINDHLDNYWVYNPTTMEVAVVPPRRMDACKLHARRCSCVIENLVLAFDSHSNGRVIALAKHFRRKRRDFYQVCVTENQGAWRSSSKPFKSHPLASGVHWHNFVVWINTEKTLFYDVRREVLRVCDPPDCSMSDYFYRIDGSFFYHLGASGGHLHFIQDQGSRLIIKEMRHDLSGWFVKHNIELSQIETSLFRSIGWDINADIKFKINFLMEEKEDSKLVLVCRNDVVLYRIQDQKSWKLCEWEFMLNDYMFLPHKYFKKFVYQHVETISRFHDQY